MNFAYTEDQEALRELARKILADLATHERLCEIEAGDAGWDSALWLELGRATLLGACLPAAQGGMGLGLFEQDREFHGAQVHATELGRQAGAHQVGRGQLAPQRPVEAVIARLDLAEPLVRGPVAEDLSGQLAQRLLVVCIGEGHAATPCSEAGPGRPSR